MTDPVIAALPPDTLRALAKAHAKSQAQSAHWTKIASIIGRVADEKLWQQFEVGAASFGDATSWAEEELLLTRTEIVQYLDLHLLMKAGATQTPGMSANDWLAVKKSTAIQLKKILALGGNLKHWRDKVAGLGVEPARVMIEQAIGKEVWTTLKIRVTPEIQELVEYALSVAASRHPELNITGSVLEPKNAFRLIEKMAVEYAAPDVVVGARYAAPIAVVPVAVHN